ncbi:non-canonical purine NTP pyrophosphatase, RdgB/HAM1 family [Flavipsychrobacter stenotrophus]|uniref:dITP/XTP pyrophosphatase n=1 Tax=Flavipsychrobacter stenotrophus TaxID=2077091 RepID=A0A2S7SQN6_9BACT|nr:RdgB/HAM1 family non-canonical purine NTP pyrophosphatase [Flavipsychrobacter stenotrophus]PQJ09048.1 non-canonical purine NTP pyrophosphatase, RdgB/HAM1 family [Flavipsychrobacter stenotrophus]
MELVIASNNKGKIREIKPLIEGIEVLSLQDVGFTDDIAEPFHTFEQNALAKASAINAFTKKNTFADDSGICVNALNGEPGVDSAHYSGTRDDEQNLQKVLKELQGADDRTAFYKAVICLIWEDEVYYFEGVCEGRIIEEKRGEGGFGYDPIFVPDGYDQTFAELPLDIKNTISHRGKAVKKMVEFLNAKIPASA